MKPRYPPCLVYLLLPCSLISLPMCLVPSVPPCLLNYTNMKIEVFAVLKDYFEPEFEIEANAGNINDLRQQLLALQPGAQNILSISRFAVNDEFIDNNFQLKESDTICIIPPSSGG